MPMDRSKYPPNWNEIATAIKEAAGWRCQHCGVEHDTHIVRDERHPASWHYATDEEMEDASNGVVKVTRVILTVHHIGVDKPDGTPGSPDDKMDCRPENLACLCQFDHLAADRDGHLFKSRQTRIANKRQSKVAAGQGELF